MENNFSPSINPPSCPPFCWGPITVGGLAIPAILATSPKVPKDNTSPQGPALRLPSYPTITAIVAKIHHGSCLPVSLLSSASQSRVSHLASRISAVGSITPPDRDFCTVPRVFVRTLAPLSSPWRICKFFPEQVLVHGEAWVRPGSLTRIVNSNVDILVIGAGPTGLGAAKRLDHIVRPSPLTAPCPLFLFGRALLADPDCLLERPFVVDLGCQ